MTTEHPNGRSGGKDLAFEILEERIAYLEFLKSFHDETLKIIRIYTSSHSYDPERCLQEIVNFIHRRFDLHLVSVLLVDPMTRELKLSVLAGNVKDAEKLRNFRSRLGEGICGYAARTGEKVVANDVTLDARYIPGPVSDTRSEIAIPIRIRDKVVGVLNIEDCATDRFKPEFVTLMEDLAVNVGFVLENNRLYDDLTQRTESLEKKIEDKIYQIRRSETRYRRIVENSPELILLTDASGTINWVNRSTCLALGYDNHELEGMTLVQIIRKGHMHKVYSALRSLGDNGTARPVPLELVTHDELTRLVEFTCHPVYEDGALVGIEFTMHDVTEKAKIDGLKKNYLGMLEEEVQRRTTEIKDTQRAAILAIANLAESIDDDTGGHIQRIRHYSRILATELRNDPKYTPEVNDEFIELVFDLSPLHDLGKVGIRDTILQKTGKLTADEFEKMKEHTEIGARALRMAAEMTQRDSLFTMGEMIAHFHHEKWDGSGYPAVAINGETRALRGDEIPLCARIVAVADVYDALSSKRPYKMPFPAETVKEMLIKQSGKHFDPGVIEAFLRAEKEFLRIRDEYSDDQTFEGHPFILPARDREETQTTN